ncbi:hypothetical protein [Atlantibacter hermannii]|uniref:hypothetical protein n=1 Tax=Atlantibacter hermannii TaxID=565 RepID=UPI0028AF9A1A|nr:hypothetical protein [Atlantibacter hermannii]
MKDMTHEQLIRATYVVAKFKDPETAKLLNELAERLDCALVAARTACLERDAAVRAEIEWETAMMQAVGEDGICDVVLAIEALKSAAGEQRAQAWIDAKDFTKSMLASDSVDHIDFLFDGKVQQIREGRA